jgi:hypothetical protein
VYYALGAAGVVLIVLTVQIALLVRVARALSTLAGLEGRVARLGEAMALLTDTAEAGFRTLNDHASAAPVPSVARRAPRAPRTSTGRVVRAAGRGKTVAEIAASEEVSEGEVRLRLSLADAAGRSAREARHGAMRVD